MLVEGGGVAYFEPRSALFVSPATQRLVGVEGCRYAVFLAHFEGLPLFCHYEVMCASHGQRERVKVWNLGAKKLER